MITQMPNNSVEAKEIYLVARSSPSAGLQPGQLVHDV
jgi:hypothetical protein